MTKNEYELAWQVPEYHQHQRTKRWYTIATAALGIMIVYALLTANFLFAIILIIIGITMTLRDRTEAPKVEVAISDDGLTVGAKRYVYSKFKNFWLYYEPDEAKMLFLEFKGGMRPRLAIPLENKNPLRVRALLLRYLPEDITKENEPFSEQVTRLLKL